MKVLVTGGGGSEVSMQRKPLIAERSNGSAASVLR